MMEFLAQLGQTFREMYGHEPPADMTLAEIAERVGKPLPCPETEIEEAIQIMRKAGIPEEIIYAYRKTDGLFVTESNQHLIHDSDLEEWNNAIREYLNLKERDKMKSNSNHPDIHGTKESLNEDFVDSEILVKVQDAITLEFGWQDGGCPEKLDDKAALGSLTRLYHNLIDESDERNETAIWRDIIELAFTRLGSLVAESKIRLVHQDLEGDPDSDEGYTPEQWLIKDDHPNSEWYQEE